MEEFQTVDCPFCGTSMEIGIDTSVEDQAFTTDCENCCRPFEIRAQCEAGEIVSVEVRN